MASEKHPPEHVEEEPAELKAGRLRRRARSGQTFAAAHRARTLRMGEPEPARTARPETLLETQSASPAKSGMGSMLPWGPARLLLVALAIVFVAEVLVMLLLPVLFPDGGGRWIKDFVDAAIQSLLVAPVLWFLIVRPLHRFGESGHARCRAIVGAAADGIVAITADGAIDMFNPAATRLFGYTPDEIVGKNVRLLMPLPHKERHDEFIARFKRTGEPQVIGLSYDVFAVRKDGSRFPAEIAISEVHMTPQSSYVAIVRDITERKAAEERLRAAGRELESRVKLRTAELEATNHRLRQQIEERKRAEQRLLRMAAAVESAGESILVTDLDGVIEYVNPAFERINGFTSEEVLGKTPRILKSGRHSASFYCDLWATLKAGRVWRGELINRRADGALIDVEKAIAPIRTAAGEAIGYVAIARDMTERKRMLEALEAVVRGTAPVADESFFRSLVYHIATALRTRGACVSEILPSGTRARTRAFWNDGHFGGDCEYDLAGTPCGQAIEQGTWSCRRDVQRLFPSDSWLSEIDADAYLGVALTDAAGSPIGVLAVTHDRPLEHAAVAEPILKIFAMRATSELRRQRIEERARQREGELAHVLRLSTMGEMASGLAHEINQPLSAIATHAAACARRLQSGTADTEKLVGAVTHIGEQAERAGQIVRRIRRFVAKREPKCSTIDLNDIVREVESLARHQARQDSVDIDLRLDDDLPLVVADGIQIEQVLQNLIRNALDAMSGDEPERRKLSIETRRAEGGAVEVSVRDTGPGLSVEAADHAFDPFFTTKSSGLGMGLSISRTLIEAHGGRMWAAPAQGDGAILRFTLPAA